MYTCCLSGGSPVTFTVKRSRRPQSCSNQVGASLIEFALIAPLMFTLIFVVVYMGFLYSARVSLSTAVGAVRTGHTRGLTGLAHIQDIEDLKNPSLPNTPSPRLQTLLASDDQIVGGAFAAGGTYDLMLSTVYGAPTELVDLSYSRLYSLVFVNQMMVQSIGPSLRYPCKEKGCLYCVPLSRPNAAPDPGDLFTGVECEYRPASVFLDPVLRLFELMSGGLVSSDVVLKQTRSFNPS